MSTPMERPSGLVTRKSSTRKPPTHAMRALTSTLERRLSASGGSRPASGSITPLTPMTPLSTVTSKDGEQMVVGGEGRVVGEEEKRALAGLLGVQSQQEELMKEMRREMMEVERKYLEKTAPLYSRRAQLVSGMSTPRDDELTAAHRAHSSKFSSPSVSRRGSFAQNGVGASAALSQVAYSDLVDAVAKAALKESVKEHGAEALAGKGRIQEFWLTALRNHRALRLLISEKDAEALKHLIDVRLEYLAAPLDEFFATPSRPASPSTTPTPLSESSRGSPGYKIVFVFEPNGFFENEVLEKTYFYRKELDWAGKAIVDYAKGCEIRWKSNEVDLTKDGAVFARSNSRSVKRETDEASFFKFFDPPARQTFDTEEVSDEDVEENEFEFMLDIQLGEDFKDLIIPRAVDYFSGKALEWEEHTDEWSDDETDYEDFDY